MQNKNGIYITIEGIDGSGKTTLAKNLYNYFKEKNFPVFLTKEPTENIIGQFLRSLFLKKNQIIDKAEYLLFAADRAQHFYEVIIPKLKSNEIIISDRSSDSSLAYQAYANGLDINMVRSINLWTTENIQPNLTFYLKINPELALERVTKRNIEISKFENLEFLKKVQNGFEEIFKDRNNVIILDASKPQDQLCKEAIENLKNVQF